ncbi:MAG: transcription-repair coupling factor [Balneolaceae bacterium]|nr:MAG: transcription-repair coupling factor [Balneolaceae bacterium]
MVEQISSAILADFPFVEVRNKLTNSENIHLGGLAGSSPILLLSEMNRKGDTLLYVTKEFDRAASVASDFEQLGAPEVFLFPPTRRRPYDTEKVVDMSVLVQRSEVLEKLNDGKASIIIASADAITEKLVPARQFYSLSIEIEKGDILPIDKLAKKLTEQGYTPSKFVDEPGEFAIRGGIFDVFPFSGEYPVRLEYFGDEIESIREFDPDSQRSIAFLNKTRLVPNAGFSENGDKESIVAYMPEDTIMVLEDAELILDEIDRHYQKSEEIFSELKEKLTGAPDLHYLTSVEWEQAISGHGTITLGSFNRCVNIHANYSFITAPHPSFNGSFKLLREFVHEQSKGKSKTLILTDHENQKERFEELLGEPGDDFNYRVIIQNLHEGFLLPAKKLAVLTDHQIFNRYHRPKIKRKRIRGGFSFKELKELNIGDYVVHVDYGIGKFAGFKKIEVRNSIQEAAVLRYKDDSILYVNVSSLHKIQKYSGKEGAQPKITRLGSGEWARKKAATRKKVKDIAKDLIELYAKRKAQQAFRFDPDNSWQTEMEARFEYEETPDQLNTIRAVKQDMESSQPMDRLVCGDVGFGKTEVALRAAFKAVMNQKQAAILVPTTILADQHFKTFSQRMKDFPVEVEVISRFRTQAEQKEIIHRLAAGKIDILIGTHRIISKDVKFKDLGLLIIDEEQRFGVAMKEKLKSFRATIDVLTLTATPIPRTLQFSLMGARDLSLIHTPPPNRQPVYTEIHSFDSDLIRDVIIQEISRGGQVFFIHNRVKNIEEVTDMIRELVPDIRIRHAHGQMPANRLEKIISDFYLNKYDVLVSTNIVENGIDIANANTIIINNANQFGLSELHQLRGRVGRSNRKAFCYLITPDVRSLTPEARKRLSALEEFSDLGSGFNIAMRDLDIRGAGDILGAEQSGYISDIGFELYTKILNDAIRELKETEYSSIFSSEPKETEFPETKVEFDLSAFLDNDYVTDNVERLNLYRKLSEANSLGQIDEWKSELSDRFGTIPETGQNLLKAAIIKFLGSRLFLSKITIRAGRMWILCPANNSNAGTHFYNTGMFQNLLQHIQHFSSGSYQVVQKNEAVTFVVGNINGIDEAIDYLKLLFDKLTEDIVVHA